MKSGLFFYIIIFRNGLCNLKCTSNDDCENDQEVCWKSKCSKSCDVSKEENVCDKNQYCHIDHGICHKFCKDTKQCSNGYTCYNSKCSKSCSGTDDCGKNQYCHE